MKRWITTTFVLFVLAGIVYAENTPGFNRQVIQVPKMTSDWAGAYWKDINEDGLIDILVLVQRESKVFIYNQNNSGFPSEPSQSIEFPKGTAWFALYDVSEHTGDEMLISTSEGIFYYPQNNGIFEIKPEKLLEAKQIIPQNHPPIVKEPDKWPEDSKNTIPVVFTDHTVIYKLNESYKFNAVRTVEHEFRKTMDKFNWNSWSIGSKGSGQIRIRTIAHEKSKEQEEKGFIAENEYIKKTVEKIKKNSRWWGDHRIEEEDINGDGRQDLALWHSIWDINPRTTIIVFIRREDGKLPEKPDQILRCSGIPMGLGYPIRGLSILNDINNDGFLEIVLAELKTKPISASSFVEMAVSKGIEWVLSIRQFKKPRGYSNKADFKMDVTTMLPMFHWVAELITFDGDFNVDGWIDLIVRRTATQCDVYLSSATSSFYDRQPKLQLEVPPEGRMSVEDLNNDGISDIYVIDYEKGKIAIFLSKSWEAKGALR